MTLKECAEKAGVGQATVLRMLEKSGYGGWSEFQKTIWQEEGSRKYRSQDKRANEIGTENVIVGIRPEDMMILPEKSEQGLEATVNVYEMLGSEAYVYFDYKGESRAIRTNADTKIRKGDRIRYTFREEGIHLFDPYHENRI